MKKIFIITTLILFLGSLQTLVAQDHFRISAPKVVAVDEMFTVVFTATGKVKEFNAPDMQDFHILAGPMSSTSSSTQIVNGKVTHSYEISYTYTLQPKSKGNFVIPSASVVMNKKTYKSEPFSVEVVAQQQQSSSGNSGQSSGTGISESDLMLKLYLNKSKVVKGEPIIATLTLYTKVGISGFEDIRFPVFNGFWSEEVETPSNVEFVRETLDGQIYNAALIRKYMLIPQQSGTLTIEPAEMICQIQIRSNSQSRNMFDGFFDDYQTIRKRISTPARKVVVAELPANAPASFTGGVGKFEMTAKLATDSIKAHEATSLSVVISGTGNFNMVEQPKVEFPLDFEAYDVKRTENVSSSSSGTSGTKTFEFPFIPRSPGQFAVDPVEFTYYDIAKRQYVTLKSAPLTIGVARGDESNAAVGVPGVNKQYVKSLGEDIRFIVTDISILNKKGVLFASTWWYYLSLLFVVALFFLIVMILNKLVDRKRDVVGAKNRKAKKVAKARLKNASVLLEQNLYSAFYEELDKALSGYVSDKFALTVTDLSRERIAEELSAKTNSEELVNRFLELLDACEYARYAPSSDSSAMANHYAMAINLISEIESKK